MDIEKIKEQKKAFEASILQGCRKFEDDTGLEIKEINMVELSIPLNPGMSEEQYKEYLSGNRKLTGISLDIRIT